MSGDNQLVLISGFSKDPKTSRPDSVFLDLGVGIGRKRWHRRLIPGICPGEYLKLIHCITVRDSRHYLLAVTSRNCVHILKLLLHPTGKVELTPEAHRPFAFDKGMPGLRR